MAGRLTGDPVVSGQGGAVAARHMRKLRPGLGRASPVILGKRFFFSENEIKFVSPYMSVIIRGEGLAH